MSGTVLRNFLKNATAEQFSGIMGWYEHDLFNMIQSKLKAEDAPPKEGELNENFLSMDSLSSLVDEALHKKYENVYSLGNVFSLIDEVVLEQNNINETSEEELNTISGETKKMILQILRLIKLDPSLDTEDVVEKGAGMADEVTDLIIKKLEGVRAEAPASTVKTADVADKMDIPVEEASGVGGGGVHGFAGVGRNKKHSRSWQDDR
jgi:predicted oxidoreductase